jgi:hypothetical protein
MAPYAKAIGELLTLLQATAMARRSAFAIG